MTTEPTWTEPTLFDWADEPVTIDTSEADALTAELHSTTDAAIWAARFCATVPGAERLDCPTVLGWFANAIETARAAGRKELCPHDHVAALVSGLTTCLDCGALWQDAGDDDA